MLVNTSDPPLGSFRAGRRVLEIQTKLHRWANDDPDHRFDDLFNLVTVPAFVDGLGAGRGEQGRTLGRGRRPDRRLGPGLVGVARLHAMIGEQLGVDSDEASTR
jgi:hypothetical protein